MLLTFDDVRHAYLLDGKPVPSVTKVISNISDDMLFNNSFIKAGVRGTEVHRICEMINNKEKVNLSALAEDIDRYVQGYISFSQAGDYEVTHSEQRVYSAKYRYAGTVDIIGRNKKGDLVVMDIKTSATVSPTAGLQMAAYAHCIEEMGMFGKEKVRERAVIWLTGDNKYDIVSFNEKSDFNTFICHLVVHNWRKKHGVQ